MRRRNSALAPLSAYWFGMQAVWGAVLGISLQAETIALHPAGYIIAYGKIAALGATVASVAQILAGIISDRMRRRGHNRVMFFVVGAGLGALAIVAFYSSTSFTALVWAFVCLQFALNIAIGPYQAIIPDYVLPARAGTASAWMGALQSAGNAAGAIAATLARWSAAKAALLAAVLLASCAVTVVNVARRPLRPLDEHRIGVGKAAADLFVSRGLLYLGFYTILGYMLFYLRDVVHARNAAFQTGIVILIFTAAGVLGAALGGRNADKADRRLVVNIGNALVVCGASETSSPTSGAPQKNAG